MKRSVLQEMINEKEGRRIDEGSEAFTGASWSLSATGVTNWSGAPGSGKVEAFLQLLKENKEARVLWIESPFTIHPPTFFEYGIHPRQIFFIESQKEQPWLIQQTLKQRLFDIIVLATNEILNERVLRLFQIEADRSMKAVLILSDQPQNSASWTFKEQRSFFREGDAIRSKLLRTRLRRITADYVRAS